MIIHTHTDPVVLLNLIEQNHLYYKDGWLVQTVKEAIAKKSTLASVTADIDSCTVGVAVIDDDCHIHAFVNETYRRRRIGTVLIKAVLHSAEKQPKDVFATYGQDKTVSGCFWDHLTVVVSDDDPYELTTDETQQLLSKLAPHQYRRAIQFAQWELRKGDITRQEYEAQIGIEIGKLKNLEQQMETGVAKLFSDLNEGTLNTEVWYDDSCMSEE